MLLHFTVEHFPMFSIDPATIIDMKFSQNPDEVHAWLDECVSQGFDQKTIRAMIRMTSEELSAVCQQYDIIIQKILTVHVGLNS
jgi:hypothetical protein